MRNMKDSGVEWIGEIPEDWKIVKLKNIAKIQTGNTPSKNNNEDYYSQNGIMWVKPDNLTNLEPIKETKEYLNDNGRRIARIVPPKTPLVCCIGSIGKVGYSDKEVAFNQQINSVEFNNNCNWKFGLYSLIANEYQHWLYANGNVLKILNNQGHGNINISLPRIEEQELIADYLDNKVKEIDNIILKTKETIEEYKKYKQSVITEVVTKGLNPNVEMKDSGIEWIGNIPDHWKIRKGKYILELLSRTILENDEVITCFRDGEVTLRSNRREDGFTFADKEIGYQGVEPNDLVIHSMDGFAGAIGISDSRGKASPVVLVCDSYQNKEYIMYYLRSMAYNEVFTALATGIRVRSCDLRWNKIGNLLYPIPSIKEQEEIVTYIKDICIQIDKMISIKQELLLELEQYKKSLIYECVTGKKEVSPAYAD